MQDTQIVELYIICNSIKADCDETTEVIRRAKEQAITYIQPRVG